MKPLRVRAEGETTSNGAAPAPAYPVVGSLTWEKDTETIRDVFAFGGSAPEVRNAYVLFLMKIEVKTWQPQLRYVPHFGLLSVIK